jgi:calcium-dependent protein kinase
MTIVCSCLPACLPRVVVSLLQLYQMLTGRLPFWPRKTLEQVSRLPLYEIIAGTRTHEVEFPRSLWAGISPAARELVSRMLDRNPATRISAEEALCHPWMCATLGFVPTPSSDTAAGAGEGLLQGGMSPVRPPLQPLSPGKGSNVSPGPLSPKRPSPLRSVLSGELPTSLLLAADMHKAPMPLLVPAAE